MSKRDIARDALRKDRAQAAAVALAVFGALVLALWLATNDGSAMSMLLALAGIGVVALAIMLYFFTPSRFLRDDVCDASSMSGVISLNGVLASMLVGTAGVHAARGEMVRVFIPIARADAADLARLRPGVAVFDVAGPVKGISIVPPGLGLFRLATGMGAAFTHEGLEGEIRDVMESGMELASSAAVRRDGDAITVSLRGMANSGLCRSIRESDPGICTRTGCPVCSFIACMVASGTGRNVQLDGARESDGVISLGFRLL